MSAPETGLPLAWPSASLSRHAKRAARRQKSLARWHNMEALTRTSPVRDALIGSNGTMTFFSANEPARNRGDPLARLHIIVLAERRLDDDDVFFDQ